MKTKNLYLLVVVDAEWDYLTFFRTYRSFSVIISSITDSRAYFIVNAKNKEALVDSMHESHAPLFFVDLVKNFDYYE